MLILLFACAGASPLVGDTLSEGGSWHLTLDTTELDRGATDVVITVGNAATDEPAVGLSLVARPGMDEMSHAMDLAEFTEGDAGNYTARLTFDMAGVWDLVGYAADTDDAEAFSFVVEVLQ